jgi:thiol-disulfide isomerase/thioredoxin
MKIPSLHKALLSIFSMAALGAGSLLAEAPATWNDIVEEATSANKPILLEFTGSDWCPPCMMMNKTVFSTDEFKTFAGSDIVFVKLDFPRKKQLPAAEQERNNAMAEKFSIQGFPTMIVLDSSGKELARKVGGMQGGPGPFIAWVKESAKGS